MKEGMNNYQFLGFNVHGQMQHSFARHTLQNSNMSVEDYSPKFRDARIAQSRVIDLPDEDIHMNIKYPTNTTTTTISPQSHRRQQSWQIPKSPTTLFQHTHFKSQCNSPQMPRMSMQRSNYQNQQQNYQCQCQCDLDMDMLWEEFLQMKLHQRHLRMQCCHQRACHLPQQQYYY